MPKQKNIVLLNRKGGCGKSTISDQLLFAFERDGMTPAFFDLDQQGSPFHETREDDSSPVAVIDTPGALMEEMAAWAKDADLVIVPTRCSTYDQAPLERMRDMLDTIDVPVIWVLNGWTRFTVSREFEEWLRSPEAGFAGKGRIIRTLPHSEMFVRSTLAGKSVIDYAPRTLAAIRMQELYEKVCEVLGVDHG